MNATIKQFINTSGVDPLVYLGSGRDEILTSTVQSMCLMMKNDWEDLESGRSIDCMQDKIMTDVYKNKHIIITHSLGSRIVLDALQNTVIERTEKEGGVKRDGVLQKTEFDIFMLSNQLPLLQIGREEPEITGKYKEYCLKGGEHYNERVIGKTDIYAFSDPNDLLSYTVQQNFVNEYIDSRICPTLANININVAQIKAPFGLVAMANPLDAHTKYDEDARVLSILANGYDDPMVQEKCTFIKLESD